MIPQPLIAAHRATLQGLLEMLPWEDNNPPSEDTSFPYLRWMLDRALDQLGQWPIDKTSRWIGCVQGVMRCRGVLDFSAERDRTRPLFHEAYKQTNQEIPPTVERTDPPTQTNGQLVGHQYLDDVMQDRKR